MDYTIKGNNITLANSYSLDFKHPIKQTQAIEDVIVIILESPFRVVYNLNVFGIKRSGDFLWRIQETELFGKSLSGCPYVNVKVNEVGELVLFNWCDTAVIIDPQTGDVIRTYQTK